MAVALFTRVIAFVACPVVIAIAVIARAGALPLSTVGPRTVALTTRVVTAVPRRPGTIILWWIAGAIVRAPRFSVTVTVTVTVARAIPVAPAALLYLLDRWFAFGFKTIRPFAIAR